MTPRQAASALGVSRAHAYALIARGEFPARVLKVGARRVVVTAALLRLLGDAPHAQASSGNA